MQVNDIIFCVIYGIEIRRSRVVYIPDNKEERILVEWIDQNGGGFVDIDQCFLTEKEAQDTFLPRKWDFEKEVYLPYEFPVDWNISLYEEDMNTIIACAECGKSIPYGECYTSRKIHTFMGIGYAVCDDCYAKELKQEMKVTDV